MILVFRICFIIYLFMVFLHYYNLANGLPPAYRELRTKSKILLILTFYQNGQPLSPSCKSLFHFVFLILVFTFFYNSYDELRSQSKNTYKTIIELIISFYLPKIKQNKPSYWFLVWLIVFENGFLLMWLHEYGCSVTDQMEQFG